jgi:hypothetical protein
MIAVILFKNIVISFAFKTQKGKARNNIHFTDFYDPEKSLKPNHR